MPSKPAKQPSKKSDSALDARAFQRALLRWYRANARDLPWRRTTDPYAIWMSEIMLQQTRVEQGLPYYERWMKQFPTVQGLADAHEDRVLKAWEGLGYYTRARNLHKAARIIAHDRGGSLPKTAEEWQALPGIGRYTAGAIASIAYGEKVPVLDGNVIRVVSRLCNLDECTDDPKTREKLWDIVEGMVPARSPGDFNQGMMELGARICTPKAPRCAECPVSDHCAARAAGTQELRPVRKQKQRTPHYEMVAAAIRNGNTYLLAKRPSAGLLGGMWEFPSEKVAPGESHAKALSRGLNDAFRVKVKVGGVIACVQHAYTHFKVTLTVYACEIRSGTPSAANHDEVRWVARKDFHSHALPKVVHKFIDLL